jgi:hypothetical protein
LIIITDNNYRKDMNYKVSEYWESVAQRMAKRTSQNEAIIAGDNEPYYEYKRKLSLDILKTYDIRNKEIFELGYGAGGNIQLFQTMSPKSGM